MKILKTFIAFIICLSLTACSVNIPLSTPSSSDTVSVNSDTNSAPLTAPESSSSSKQPPSDKNKGVAVSKVFIKSERTEIKEGGRLPLTPTFVPNNATLTTLKWTSSDEAIATVNSKGVVTAKSFGYVTITATAQSGASAEIELFCYPKTAGATFPKETVTVYSFDSDTTIEISGFSYIVNKKSSGRTPFTFTTRWKVKRVDNNGAGKKKCYYTVNVVDHNGYDRLTLTRFATKELAPGESYIVEDTFPNIESGVIYNFEFYDDEG